MRYRMLMNAPHYTLALILAATNALADSPWPRHTIDDASQGADGVRLADFNQDGLPDIVTPWEEGGSIRIAFHPGHESVTKPWPSIEI